MVERSNPAQELILVKEQAETVQNEKTNIASNEYGYMAVLPDDLDQLSPRKVIIAVILTTVHIGSAEVSNIA